MMTKWMAKGYLWLLLVLLYSPILIIMIFSFTEAKVLGNWTGFSTKLYSSRSEEHTSELQSRKTISYAVFCLKKKKKKKKSKIK